MEKHEQKYEINEQMVRSASINIKCTRTMGSFLGELNRTEVG